MESRNEVFQKLKPICVALGQAALSLNGSRPNVQEVGDRLEKLKHALSTITTLPNALDSKLAGYVFFPISQVLKTSQRVTIRCLELALQCIAILIDQGWQDDIPAQLAAQIVILCSLLAEKKPKSLSFAESTDELQASAFWCLYHLFSVAGSNEDTRTLLTDESNFPQLGQTISVILDGIHDGGAAETQVAATSALQALVSNVAGREIHASFLPGIMSKLTKVLTPQSKQRRNHTVLIGCLDVIGTLFKSTLGDSLADRSADGKRSSTNGAAHLSKSIIDAKWQEAAATQLMPALQNIMRLKNYGRDDVKEALARLCMIILGNCRKVLSNCMSLALETLIAVITFHSDAARTLNLGSLISAEPSISQLLQNTLYDWLKSLTNTMQSSDEQAKSSKLQQIMTAYGLLTRSGVNTDIVDRMLATSLRDAVVVTINVPSNKQQLTSQADPIRSLDLTMLDREHGTNEFAAPLVQYKGQEEIMNRIQQFAKLIISSRNSLIFAGDLARSLRQSYGETQMADFWLLLTATRTAVLDNEHVKNPLTPRTGSSSDYHEQLEDIYSLSLSILNESSDEPPDTRLQALALRTLALRAQTAGEDFRYELVDALYPVLHMLATPDEQLQRDSITTLNIITSACGYSSVKDLIVENVDYLTNAVALKLNAFDVSPQAPQVLLMMVRLAGPSLLPYLEDTIESIFAALEDYHGYPVLVELLFKVLAVMAEEGVKTPQLAITDSAVDFYASIMKERWQPTTVAGLAALLKERKEDESETSEEEVEPHPKRPWKNTDDATEGDEDDEDELRANSQQNQQVDDAESQPPAPKSYNLLLKITELTQHFLPSASTSLRTSLLSLIKTTVPAIARHENSFLPLINTLWPEIVSRLDDDEAHIQTTALDVVAVLCQYAGDFMRTRVVQLWPRLVEIHQIASKAIIQSQLLRSETSSTTSQQSTALVADSRRLKQAVTRMEAAPANYGDTTTRLLWLAVTATLTKIVEFVQLSPELVDEALEKLQSVLDQPQVGSVFEQDNADALWLAGLRSGTIIKPQMPIVGDNVTWRFAEISV